MYTRTLAHQIADICDTLRTREHLALYDLSQDDDMQYFTHRAPVAYI